jgi:hypothetical protein
MSGRILAVLLALGLLLAAGPLAGTAPTGSPKKSSKLEKERVKVCKDICEAYLDLIKVARAAPGEALVEWSRRWVKAEKAVRQKPDDLIAVYKTHWERTKSAEKNAKGLHDAGKIPTMEYNALKYYRIEAEIWLNEAKGKK